MSGDESRARSEHGSTESGVSGMNAERYIVLIDGRWHEQTGLSRNAAISAALRNIDTETASEVVIADARTYAVRALWYRLGCHWRLRATQGWDVAEDEPMACARRGQIAQVAR